MAHTAHTDELTLYNGNTPLMATKSKRKGKGGGEGVVGGFGLGGGVVQRH